jgi:hypothetical protein
MSELLTAADIAGLTTIDLSAMNEAWTITDVTFVPDSGGSTTTTEATRATVGYFWSVSGDEAGADQIRARGRHRLAIPKTVAVEPTAKMTQASTGKVFQIKYVFPVSGYSTSLILGLEDA